jgi:hypothetical protein
MTVSLALEFWGHDTSGNSTITKPRVRPRVKAA